MKDKLYYIEILKNENMMDTTCCTYFELCEFEKGDYILCQGQTLEYLYIMMNGHIKSCHTTANGTTFLHAFSKPIAVIGEIEFLGHNLVINDVLALEKTICLRISMALYEDILLNDLKFMRYLAKTISSKLHESNNNSSISVNYPVENRLASYLIACHENLFIKQNFVQVAEMIGCSYRQLQRTLNEFCQKKYIVKITRGQFKILDPNTLKKLGQDLYYL